MGLLYALAAFITWAKCVDEMPMALALALSLCLLLVGAAASAALSLYRLSIAGFRI